LVLLLRKLCHSGGFSATQFEIEALLLLAASLMVVIFLFSSLLLFLLSESLSSSDESVPSSFSPLVLQFALFV
jgi:hypothetical protein